MRRPGPVEVTDCELLSVTGEQIHVPDPEHLVHLQFRRFAGCPICNLHLQSIVQRHDEIAAAGIRFRAPAVHQDGGHLGLPADFLVDTGGAVIAAKHGVHAYDQ
jgi:hypothetical protein